MYLLFVSFLYSDGLVSSIGFILLFFFFFFFFFLCRAFVSGGASRFRQCFMDPLSPEASSSPLLRSSPSSVRSSPRSALKGSRGSLTPPRIRWDEAQLQELERISLAKRRTRKLVVVAPLVVLGVVAFLLLVLRRL